MPEKSASIAQQRLLGMAWAARTNRLDTSKIKDKSWREKVEKIAKSDKFSDDTLHKMASTKYKDEKTGKMRPYLIGKGTPENPEKKRRPYKKKNEAITESLVLTYEEYVNNQNLLEFYQGYCDALLLMEDNNIPTFEELMETLIANAPTSVLGLNHNRPGITSAQTGIQQVKRWKNVQPDTEWDTDIEDPLQDEESIGTETEFIKSRMTFKSNPYIAETFEQFLETNSNENVQLNPGMNIQGMGSVTMPGSPGSSSDFHNQAPGSGDMPARGKVKDDEEEEEEAKRILKALKVNKS